MIVLKGVILDWLVELSTIRFVSKVRVPVEIDKMSYPPVVHLVLTDDANCVETDHVIIITWPWNWPYVSELKIKQRRRW